MAVVARAGPHRRVKDDEVVAHYARVGDRSPGVIRIDELAERVGVALPRLCILRMQNDPGASDDDSKAPSAAAGRESASEQVSLRDGMRASRAAPRRRPRRTIRSIAAESNGLGRRCTCGADRSRVCRAGAAPWRLRAGSR